ncbi:MAG: hypothetical protein M1602_03740 [Firmicutes bacterium]|nr:hypothetical protein [Bacillota bacterium]
MVYLTTKNLVYTIIAAVAVSTLVANLRRDEIAASLPVKGLPSSTT